MAPPTNGAAWKIATVILGGLLSFAAIVGPVILTPLMAGTMRSVARDEVRDHERKLHEAVADARDERNRVELLADIVARLDRIEGTLRGQREAD